MILCLIIISMVISISIGCTEVPLKNGEESNVESQELVKDVDQNIDKFKIVDMAGREVLISKTVEKVFSTGPVGTILLYTLSPDKIAGWNYTLRDGEKRYIDKKYHDLPDLGGAGKSSINYEELLKQNPEVLIEMTTINEQSINKVEEIQTKLNIPIVLIDDHIKRLDESYQLLGQIVDEEQGARRLSNYVKSVLQDIKINQQNITENEKIKVYYAEGPNGLETEPSGSWHAEIIDMVGGKNVAEVGITDIKGKSEASIEQIIAWDPEIIISWDDERGGYYTGILSDPIWKDIKAVRNREVYEIENNPFNWFDRPPSVNRILGIQWIGNLLYPEIYDYDMKEVVKEFYYEFYHYDLNEEELDEILKNTIR